MRLRKTSAIAAIAFALPLSGCSHLAGLHFYSLSSASMQPTLYEGDKIVVDERYYASHTLSDGDIIAFRHGDNMIVKRVSARPGETIEGRHGVLIRNGQPLAENYIAPPKNEDIPELATFHKRIVAPNELFVTGDNRGASLDSRTDEFGVVRVQDVAGKVVSVYASEHRAAGRSF